MEHKRLMKLMIDKDIKVVKREGKLDITHNTKGTDVYLRDELGFLNNNGKHTPEPTTETINLSGDGFDLYTQCPTEIINQINQFYALHNMETIEDFAEALKYLEVPNEG